MVNLGVGTLGLPPRPFLPWCLLLLPLFLILYHCDAFMVPAQASPPSVGSAPRLKAKMWLLRVSQLIPSTGSSSMPSSKQCYLPAAPCAHTYGS